jgi:glycosyl transferase, family 25
MSKLNQLFDKIYVLTIKRNLDRHSKVYEQLGNSEFEFWYGTDIPQKFPQYEYVIQMPDIFFLENGIDKGYASFGTKGQLGAYFSIKKIIENVSLNHNCVLIFEDDFQVIYRNWEKKVEDALNELPADWDILLLGYFYYGKIYKLSYNRNLRWIPKLYNHFKYLLKRERTVIIPEKISKNLDKSGSSLGGHAYCLSKKGAEKLMLHMNPMRDSGDLLVSRLIQTGALNAYSVYPCLFNQNREFESKTEVVNL